MKNSKRFYRGFVLFTLFNFIWSCAYYKPVELRENESIPAGKDRVHVVHWHKKAWALKDVILEDDLLKGSKAPDNWPKGVSQKSVHFYIKESVTQPFVTDSTCSIPMNDFDHIILYDKDGKISTLLTFQCIFILTLLLIVPFLGWTMF